MSKQSKTRAWLSRVGQLFRRFWWLVIIVVLLAAAGFWWWQRQHQKQQAIETVQPQLRDLTKLIEFSGQVTADKLVKMRFALGGKVVYVGAKEGEEVKKGQTIASLDQRSAQKDLDKKLSLYLTQRMSFENSEDTRDDRWIDTQEQREAVQDQESLDRTVIDVESQSLSIENYRLSAPFDGILIDAPVEYSGIQALATDIWTLVDPQTLYFEVYADEVDVDEITIGQKALVALDSHPEQKINAVVETIGYQAVNTSDGVAFPVKVRFLDSVSIEQQRLGMNGEAQLILDERKQVLSLPVETLISRNGSTLVEVWQGGKKEEKEISIGLETEDYVEVLDGLTQKDQVVLP